MIAADAQSSRPNILFLIADDLGWSDVGWHGSEIKTPHLDRLARGGVILDQHYVTPMCSSTRACLLSGRYSTRFALDGATNSLVFPFGMTTLAGGLQSLGYTTALTGKWHLGSLPKWGPLHFGFDRGYGSLAGGVDQYSHLYKRGDYQRTWHRNHQFVEEEGHATDLIGGEAIDRIREAVTHRQPWYIQVAFTAVHIPIQEPDRWIKQYEDAIPDPSRRRFAACTSHMDDVIGKMVDALEETEQIDNTLIVFTSDNGGSGPWKPTGLYPGQYEPCPVLGNNAPLRGRKGTVFEGGIRVPAFVHWRGTLPSGRTLNHPLHIVDWMPTLFQLTGYEADPATFKFDGRNIWPLLTWDVTDPEPREMYFSRGKSAAIRSGDWKWVVNGSRQLLFDLSKDPHESHDVASSYPDQAKAMAMRLADQRERERGAKLAAPKP